MQDLIDRAALVGPITETPGASRPHDHPARWPITCASGSARSTRWSRARRSRSAGRPESCCSRAGWSMPGSRRRPRCRKRHRAAAADLFRLQRSASGMGAAAVGQRPRGAGARLDAGAGGSGRGAGGAGGGSPARPRKRPLEPRRGTGASAGHRSRPDPLGAAHPGPDRGAGNPLGITGLRDAADRGLRFATRSEGAGSQRLLDVLLAREGLSMTDLRTPSTAPPRPMPTSPR
jgi:hypothetical protein